MMLFLCCAYFINAISPKLAGKFQTTTTIIKLIPLGLMAVVGIISGLVSPTHMLANNFAFVAENAEQYSTGHLLLSAVCATAFAYEGWIIATSINAELKDAKRNLPKALIIGGIIIIAVYIAYYVGVAGGATVETLMDEGATSAFVNIFGGVLGNILNLFIAISCMGTMNGLMLGCSRGLYSLAARGEAPRLRSSVRSIREPICPRTPPFCTACLRHLGHLLLPVQSCRYVERPVCVRFLGNSHRHALCDVPADLHLLDQEGEGRIRDAALCAADPCDHRRPVHGLCLHRRARNGECLVSDRVCGRDGIRRVFVKKEKK